MEAVTKRQMYVDQVRRWLPGAYDSYDEHLRQWREDLSSPNPFGEVGTPSLPVTVALAEAFLSVEDGDDELATRAGERLATLRQFADEIPGELIPDRVEYADGMPPQGNFFVLPHYCEAYQLIRDHRSLSPATHVEIQAIIADSLPGLFCFAEWGSHNRAMLRAWALAAAAAVCPDRPERERWRQMSRQLAADSIRGWTVEDASSYHALWSRAVIAYVDQSGQAESFFRQPTTRFYYEYYLNLLCPIGGLADFGDSDWVPCSDLHVPILERAAREYGDGHFRWAAAQLYERLADAADTATFGDPANWIHSATWMDEGVAPCVPDWGSCEVLEELATKKVVFRNGWAPESTFLLLNYKPETGYGRTIREYMKNTISVEAEKAHHGHSDENAVSTLVSGGSLLLHDGGYREELPNGKYRADYYHARPVVRRGLLRRGESVYEFLHDDGHHRPMETERIDFRTFEEVEFSRTRAADRVTGYEHDRVIAYLKMLDLFVLVDAVTFLQAGPYSVSNLFYTHQVTATGGSWFDGRIGEMRAYVPREGAGRQLLVAMVPGPGKWEGSEEVRRYYTDEILLHQSASGQAKPGERLVFCTVLVPHDGEADPSALAAQFSAVRCSRPSAAAAVEVSRDGETITLGVKLDLQEGIVFEDVRPRYTWESRRTVYGDYETDGHFLYARRHGQKVSWAWTEATRLDCGGRTLFVAPEGTFPLQYTDPKTRRGTASWRAWEDTSQLAQDTGRLRPDR
ncbi:hypothetical protein ACFL6X_05720 [Candidatus Latescibacterota bacterium]